MAASDQRFDGFKFPIGFFSDETGIRLFH